ncbi:hypothetical protein J6590_036972 [Homalodisca vitripennis]|nr:hypothetical protein J6590_036972 [Homalodisca vitripennis]
MVHIYNYTFKVDCREHNRRPLRVLSTANTHKDAFTDTATTVMAPVCVFTADSLCASVESSIRFLSRLWSEYKKGEKRSHSLASAAPDNGMWRQMQVAGKYLTRYRKLIHVQWGLTRTELYFLPVTRIHCSDVTTITSFVFSTSEEILIVKLGNINSTGLCECPHEKEGGTRSYGTLQRGRLVRRTGQSIMCD